MTGGGQTAGINQDEALIHLCYILVGLMDDTGFPLKSIESSHQVMNKERNQWSESCRVLGDKGWGSRREAEGKGIGGGAGSGGQCLPDSLAFEPG